MKTTLQIFVSEVPGIQPTANNFPLIEFETPEDLHAFVKKLVSIPRTHNIPGGYFVLNNPQHLPDSVRNCHMYPAPERERRKQCWNDADSETDSDSEDEYYPLTLDGCFPINDNLHILRQVKIDNNSLVSYGFNDYVNATPS
jgi:hypothetical protein